MGNLKISSYAGNLIKISALFASLVFSSTCFAQSNVWEIGNKPAGNVWEIPSKVSPSPIASTPAKSEWVKQADGSWYNLQSKWYYKNKVWQQSPFTQANYYVQPTTYYYPPPQNYYYPQTSFNASPSVSNFCPT